MRAHDGYPIKSKGNCKGEERAGEPRGEAPLVSTRWLAHVSEIALPEVAFGAERLKVLYTGFSAFAPRNNMIDMQLNTQ
jgi:hypothetical protein